MPSPAFLANSTVPGLAYSIEATYGFFISPKPSSLLRSLLEKANPVA